MNSQHHTEGNLNVKLDLSKYRGKGYKVLVYRNNQIEELEIVNR